MTISYLYSKLFKKYIRGKSVLDSKVDKTACIYSGTHFYKSSLGRYSYIGYDSEIIYCEIGNFCSLANQTIIGGATHPLDWVSTSPVFYNVAGGTNSHLGNKELNPFKKTYIGNDVWVGERAIILQGLSVGNGAVIGAGSVVTKDVPPYAIVAGCPAKVIRYRFDEDTISALEKVKWWNFSDEKLRQFSEYINDPKVFVEKLNGTK